ncbi:MAG TPA: hypothetical protein VKH19_15985 [Gemmatimonadaceae bacterium]|nr:hypothetical protein [Gemmatimonadaceae bacterium]
MAQFRQPDFSKGDPNTLGGYMAVHDRPAAFEGSDGFSYSVEILADRDDISGAWGAYLFFVKWARIGASSPEGHLESDVLARDATEESARSAVGALALSDVKRVLDELIARAPGARPARKWWDAMAAENEEEKGAGEDGGHGGPS